MASPQSLRGSTCAETTLPAAALLLVAAFVAMAGVAGGAAVPGVETCPAGYFRCLGGEGCVPKEAHCDGSPDCADATDEYACVTDADGNLRPPPPREEASAAESDLARKESMEAGGPLGEEGALEAAVGEAAEGEASWNATSSGCTPDEHRCLDGTCISKERICDGPKDCFDGSDEDVLAGCLASTALPREPRECTEQEFRCRDGTCLPSNVTCNYRVDCPDGSDELLPCPPSHFECEDDFQCNDGRCVPFEWVCNGLVDCLDKSDEDPNLCANWTAPTPRPKTGPKNEDFSFFPENPRISGDPCEHMSSSQRELCWKRQLQDLKMEELQMRQRVAQEQLESVAAEASAAKQLRLQQLTTAELQRRAAADLLQQQTELHEARLQALKQTMVQTLQSSEPTVKTTAEADALTLNSPSQ